MINRIIPLLLFIGLASGQDYDYYKIRSPYISPGIQIGINANKQLFWGFQLSGGLIIQGHAPNENIETLDFINPAVTYGYKKYFKSKISEKYLDLQVTVFPDIHDSPIIGVGIGKIKSDDYSSLRLKAYTWALVAAVFDFELKTGETNFSLIPVIPIGNY
jgi:hypothetical protein|tara:strand:- start:157 stop:636 length:480 start_codon:yes stop_codon:yes gene_type:complete